MTFTCIQCGQKRDERERCEGQHVCVLCDDEFAFRLLVDLLNEK